MRNLVAIFALMFAASATANTYDAEVWYNTDFVDLGVSESEGSKTLGGSLTLNNLFSTDLFVSGQINAWDLSDDVSNRIDASVGFAGDVGRLGLTYEVGVGRSWYSESALTDYDEIFVGLGRTFGDLELSVTASQFRGNNVEKDIYTAIGGRFDVSPKVWVSAEAAAYRYDATGTYQYHHTEARAGINLAKGLDVYGAYVLGHTNVENVSWAGVRYTF
jgi:hypothetical protein